MQSSWYSKAVDTQLTTDVNTRTLMFIDWFWRYAQIDITGPISPGFCLKETMKETILKKQA